MEGTDSGVETWVPIAGWEGLYDVSDHGRYRRMANYAHYPGVRNMVGHIYRPKLMKFGYYQVVLNRDGICSYDYMHRVVAAAFIGPCPEGHEVNHKDGNKANNHVRNLEYMTKAENRSYSAVIGLTAKGVRNGHAKLNDEKVREIRVMLSQGKTCAEIGRLFLVDEETIGSVKRGMSWTHVI